MAQSCHAHGASSELLTGSEDAAEPDVFGEGSATVQQRSAAPGALQGAGGRPGRV
jgi:hypothetical protein